MGLPGDLARATMRSEVMGDFHEPYGAVIGITTPLLRKDLGAAHPIRMNYKTISGVLHFQSSRRKNFRLLL
jgi:hypothetical protein